MICTKCGTQNRDERLACHACGHKLQSSRRSEPVVSVAEEPEEQGLAELPSPYRRGGPLAKYFESWACVAALAAAAIFSVVKADYRPLYAAIPAVALIAWLRKF